MKNKQNWFGGLFTSFLNLPIFLFGALWGTTYLTQAHHLSPSSAGDVIMMLFVGQILGSPVFGWFSDKIQKRKAPMFVGAFFAVLALLGIMLYPTSSFGLLGFLFFTLGFAMGAQVLGYPLVAESNSLSLTGTAEGLASTLVMSGGLTQPLFGWLIDLHWHHNMLHGLPLYSASNFDYGLVIMPIACVLAIIVTLLARETLCRHTVSE